MAAPRRGSQAVHDSAPASDPFVYQPAFNELRSNHAPVPGGPQDHHAGATEQTNPVTGRRASLRETPTVSSRSSTSEFDDSHLDDLEKSLPIETVPSLRLHTLQSYRGTHDSEKALNGGPAVQVKSTFDFDTDEKAPSSGGDTPRPHLSIRQRLAHFTWAWYTLTMSTGGLSLLIRAQPHQFPGLRQIGLAVYAINIALFVLVTSAQAARCVLFPGTFTRSLAHPREGFFFPTFFLSLATIITSTQRYCVPEDPEVARATSAGLLMVLQVAFWIYVVATTVLAVGQYSFVFAAHSFGLQTMMPTWILPIFPVMLSGTIASVIAASQPPAAGVPIVVAGLTCQGLGLAVAFLMYAHMVGRLMQSGLPNREHRTGLFMCVGPPAFTALAFIGLARGLPEGFDHDMDGVLDTAIVETMGVVGAGFLWALSFWWFGIAVTAVIQSPPKDFHLGWWAAVFPNTGFTLATISLGSAFQNEPVLWFATVMSIVLVITFFFVLYHHVRAVIKQDIMYPGRDEDVEDH
ncbi:voltage-dependent anion channel-domain-containing protein [Staphylotrichum tortipilum]|uniref:Voltage-dependent anion channel-domain-containing protein n=1 Tax=Staphylotrichum tortipilum TaxID=2831512 RepID=A0AAN6MMT4_9PEZI|nr:voltage-dependent anion channel-domain-containing protein [Staphylotrichum longicolle]